MTDLASFISGPDEDGDVCRVCRVEADDEEPLIYPCKCSGSVRFVHPDCLKNWLAHSQKRHCEICGHRYTFTKVYPDYIPSTIPKIVFLRQSFLWAYRILCQVNRFWMVMTAWLVVLPSLNMVTLRTVVWLADTGVSFQSTPNDVNATATGNIIAALGSSTKNWSWSLSFNGDVVANGTTRANDESLRVGDILSYPITTALNAFGVSVQRWLNGDTNTLPGFVFRGQVLSITVAAVLIGLILFREWIMQHNFAEATPTTPENEEEIKPDEWIIRGGVAHRAKDYAKMLRQRTMLSRAALGKSWRHRLASLPVPESSSKTKTRPPLEQHKSALDLLASTSASASEAEKNDVPTGLSPPSGSHFRRASWPSTIPPSVEVAEASGRKIVPEITGFVRSRPVPISQEASEWEDQPVAGPSRPCEPALMQSDVAYTAPEMLSEKGKGKAKADPDAEVAAENVVDAVETLEARVEELQRRLQGKRMLLKNLTDEPAVLDPPPGPLGVSATEDKPPDTVEMERVSSVESLSAPSENTPSRRPSITVSEATSVASTVDAADTMGKTPDFLHTPLPPEELVDGDPPDDTIGLVNIENVAPPVVAEPMIAVPPLPVPAGGGADDVEVHFLAEDEEDGPWEREDWDGILEVIGLIGPLNNLFQNLAFAITIMGAAVTLLIGIPLFIGKLILIVEVVKPLSFLVQTTAKGMRIITAPIADIVTEIMREVVFAPMLSSIQALERILARKLGLVGSRSSSFRLDLSTKHIPMDRILTALDLETMSEIWQRGLQALQSGYERGMERSVHLASSHRLADNVWCLLLGYATAGLAVSILAFLAEGRFGAVPRKAVEQFKQLSLLIKLAFFMGIELVVFPLVIGTVINICTIPLFEGGSLSSRVTDLHQGPFGVIFISWLVGTLFMFGFATFLSHIRTASRKGALFFIRDPADQSFSPVKDILERSAGSQFRKLTVSAVMYTIIIACLFGVTCWGLALQPWFAILPLRMNNMSPISSVPFDLLFVHLAVPPLLESTRPKQRATKLWHMYWRATSLAFSLTSLLHRKDSVGRRAAVAYPGPKILESLWPILDPLTQILFGRYDPTATYARVPASDQVALLPQSERKNGGVFIPLDADGKPKTDEDKIRFLKQDRKARRMKRDPRADYTIVWLPQYWKTRVYAFIFSAITVSSASIAVVFFLPIVVGRAAWGMAVSEPVHDGYTYIAGAYICYLALSVGKTVRKRIAQIGLAGRLRNSTTSSRIKRSILSALNNAYVLGLLYFVLPSLVGLIFELYEAMTWKYGKNPDQVLVLHFWDAWAVGMAITSLLLGLGTMISRRLPRDSRAKLERLSEQLQSPFLVHFQDVNRTVLPILAILTLPIVLPPIISALFLCVSGYLGCSDQDNALFFRLSFPMTSSVLIIIFARGVMWDRLGVIRQQMIDAEYVVDERVENYEPTTSDALYDKEGKLIDEDGGSAIAEDGSANGEVDEDGWEDEEVHIIPA